MATVAMLEGQADGSAVPVIFPARQDVPAGLRLPSTTDVVRALRQRLPGLSPGEASAAAMAVADLLGGVNPE